MSKFPEQTADVGNVAQCRIIHDPREVAARLGELAIPGEMIAEVRKAWARGESSVSPFGPKNGAGMEAWLRAIETLREMLSIEGWKSIDVRGIAPYVQSPDGAVALTVASGDYATGVRHLTPITKNPKGIVIEEAIERNWQQLPLDFGPECREVVAPAPLVIAARLTLILLMSTVRTKRSDEPEQIEYRAELSTPWEMANQRVTAWRERILFPTENGGGGEPSVKRTSDLPVPGVDMSPELNIPVPRKRVA